MRFNVHIGIDYSGAETATSRLSNLQAFSVGDDGEPVQVSTPTAPAGHRWNWNRAEIARWIVAQGSSGQTFIAGIDHAFSFPVTYLERHDLANWDAFLKDFCHHWPTHGDGVWVGSCRKGNPRTGSHTEFRLTDTWTSSAKSVFRFDVQGQVAAASHAGIPWLAHIRRTLADRIHFWPFDGWSPPAGKSVIAEVYPAIFSKRWPRAERTTDMQDAYATARWLLETDRQDALDHYLRSPLTEAEKRIAEREGWILGIA